MKNAAWINLIAGVWLVVASFTIATASTTVAPVANDIVVAILLVGTSWWILATPAPPIGALWFQVLCGIWLIVSPSVLGYKAAATTIAVSTTSAPATNAILTGIVVMIAGLLESTAAVRHHPA